MNKEDKRKSWNNAIAINQVKGDWIPDEEYLTLIEQDINGEITTEEIVKMLVNKYTVK